MTLTSSTTAAAVMSQIRQVTADAPPQSYRYELANERSGSCLSPAGGGANNNDTIVQYNCDNDPSRRWVEVFP